MVSLLDQKFDDLLTADPARGIASFAAMRVQMIERGVCFSDKPLPASLKPHMVPREEHRLWIKATEDLVEALGELGALLLKDEELYARLKLPAGSRELIDIDPGYKRIVVSCRPDFAHGEGWIRAYEVNTDSPAMMTFTDFLQDILKETHPFSALLAEHPFRFNLRTEQMLAATIESYREWGGAKSAPTIAIIDWRGQKTAQEQSATAACFTKLGCPSFTCDPRELAISNRKLTAQGREIDIVQRRVLFPDFITRAPELEVLIRAYRDGTACVINPLRSYLVGNKVLLALLNDPAVLARMSPRARRAAADHVPKTRVVDDELRRELIEQRTNSVLKGAFSYGGHEVVIGKIVPDAEWTRALAMTQNGQWVVQEFVEPPRCRVPRFGDSDGLTWEELYSNWNPFVFGGKFAGAMTRASANFLVSITARGALLPVIECDE